MKKPTSSRPRDHANGYASKADLRRLKLSIDNRFDRFERRFDWFKDDWEIWKKDTFRLFEHRWQQFVDPVLKELETIRQEQIMHDGQHGEINEQLGQMNKSFESLDQRVGGVEKILSTVVEKLDKVATKVGA